MLWTMKPHMAKQGPLILVDDDAEDQELMLLSLEEVGNSNEVKVFQSAEAALEFLYSAEQPPFMIVSDINMPKMNGIEFKKEIDNCNILRQQCIPFVFLTTSTRFVDETCSLNIQGYFEKGNSLDDLNETMRTILSYWRRTKHTSYIADPEFKLRSEAASFSGPSEFY